MNIPLKSFTALLLSIFLLQGCSNDAGSSINGPRKAFYEDGKIESEKTYLNGELNGISKVYYKNGQLAWEGRYLNGKLDGTAKFYYENGSLQAERLYVDGVQTGQAKLFSPQGTLMGVFTVENGRKHGEATYFYQTGVPLKKENYVHGIKDGPETIYGRDGQVKSTRMYRNGNPVGEPPALTDSTQNIPQINSAVADEPAAVAPPKEALKDVNKVSARPSLVPRVPTPEELLRAAERSAALSKVKLPPPAEEAQPRIGAAIRVPLLESQAPSPQVAARQDSSPGHGSAKLKEQNNLVAATPQEKNNY